MLPDIRENDSLQYIELDELYFIKPKAKLVGQCFYLKMFRLIHYNSL